MRDSKNSHFSGGIPHENPNSLIIKLIASDVEHKAPNPLVVTSGVVA